MVIDQTITLGNLIEITAIVTGGLAVLLTMRSTLNNLQGDMVDMKTEIRKIGEVLTVQAVTNQRVDNLEKDVRELRHGEGFVFPFERVKAAGRP